MSQRPEQVSQSFHVIAKIVTQFINGKDKTTETLHFFVRRVNNEGEAIQAVKDNVGNTALVVPATQWTVKAAFCHSDSCPPDVSDPVEVYSLD